jgi:hypothetical protein
VRLVHLGAVVTAASDDARRAIAVAIGNDDPEARPFFDEVAGRTLAAVMPDGRTVAEWIDGCAACGFTGGGGDAGRSDTPTGNDARQPSDHAHDLLGYALGDPNWDMANRALNAVMPDGRTIAQRLNDGAVAERLVRDHLHAEAQGVRVVFLYGGYYDGHIEDPEAADLLDALEADRG